MSLNSEQEKLKVLKKDSQMDAKLDDLELALIEEEMKRQNPLRYWLWKMAPYVNNPYLFVTEMLGADPTPQQKAALEAIAKNTHVSIKSGHGTGKTAFDAWIILWWMYTRQHSKCPCTAPTEAQLKDVLWSELAKWWNKLDKFFKEAFMMTSDRFYHKDHDKTWFAVARTARKEKPEALQGFHGEHLLFIIEEASGVAEEVFTVVRGALTDEANRCVMTSNPTRTVGFFYNSHELWDGEPWVCLTFNGEDSPLVSDRFIREIAVEYGEESDVYRVRVKGEFPLESDYTLIPKDWIVAAMKREISYPKRLMKKKFDTAGVDIARYGENKTVFVLVRGVSVVAVWQYPRQSTMVTAGKISKLADFMEADSIRIDEAGVGGGVVDRLWELGHNVAGVDVSRKSTQPDKFANLRAEYYWDLRSRFEEGSISLKPIAEKLSKTAMVQLVEQLSNLRYEYNSSQKIAIWTKEKMRREGIKSPDFADALMLAFSEYDPELFKEPPKTALHKWSDQLEEPGGEYRDHHEEFANEFYRMSRYPVEDPEEDYRW